MRIQVWEARKIPIHSVKLKNSFELFVCHSYLKNLGIKNTKILAS